MKLLVITIVEVFLIQSVWSFLNGPFVFFGHSKLAEMKFSALTEPDKHFLIDLYNKSPAIIVFTRDLSSKFNESDFVAFKDLLSETNHAYITNHQLNVDPMEYNTNTEVVNLVGPLSQQDVELSALYRDASITYGDGNVLGILSINANDFQHRTKRDAEEYPTAPDTSYPVGANEQSTGGEQDEEFVYYPTEQSYKILLYTQYAPILINGTETIVLNDTKTTITTNKRSQNTQTLKVRYNSKARLSLEYIFTISNGYWTLNSVEINGDELILSTKPLPSAPMGFSYKCSKYLLFESNGASLQLSNIQVQVNVNSKTFSGAYDCIGFTTASIWSGIFVGFFFCLVAGIGLNCIVSIKAPSRFESSRGKQLTFTIQE